MPDKSPNSNGYRAICTERCPDLSVSVMVSELTVNQPPHGFEGSSPSSPTILLRACALRRIGTLPNREAGCPPKPWRRRADAGYRNGAGHGALRLRVAGHPEAEGVGCPPKLRPERRGTDAIARYRTNSGLLRRFRLRSLSYGGQVAPRNDVENFSAQIRFSNSEYNLRCESAIPRRDAPEWCVKRSPNRMRGRGECRVPNAPAASRAKCEVST